MRLTFNKKTKAAKAEVDILLALASVNVQNTEAHRRDPVFYIQMDGVCVCVRARTLCIAQRPNKS